MKVKFSSALSVFFFLLIAKLFSQGQDVNITLTFQKEDTLNVCIAKVTSHDSVVKDVVVKVYVQRMSGPLQIGRKMPTNESGIARFIFPNDIPSDINGKLNVIAKTDANDNFSKAETIAEVDWGVKRGTSESQYNERSLSAPRNRAPVYLIVISNLILFGVWGTLMYVISLIFKLKTLSKQQINK